MMTPVSKAVAAETPNTRASGVILSADGKNDPAVSARCRSSVVHHASGAAAAMPSAANVIVSTNTCWIRRQRLAPSAVRIAVS
jgi:hypothetical protein